MGGHPSAVAARPRGVEPVAGRWPRLSVVIPSYRAADTLPAVLAALEPQVQGRNREVVLVDSSGDSSVGRVCLDFPWVRLVERPARTLPGRARNLGARKARGELLAFVDADAVPQPDFLDMLERQLHLGVDLAVAAVCNGTPRSPTGTAGYLLEFFDFAPFRRRAPAHGASCALLVRRSAFERVGGFPEDLWPAEDTVFSLRVTEQAPLTFVPSARVVHLNRCGLRPYLAHQRRLGASFQTAACCANLPGGRFAARPLVFLAGPLRAVSLAMRLGRHPRSALVALVLAPWLAIGLAAWNVGAISGKSS